MKKLNIVTSKCNRLSAWVKYANFDGEWIKLTLNQTSNSIRFGVLKVNQAHTEKMVNTLNMEMSNLGSEALCRDEIIARMKQVSIT